MRRTPEGGSAPQDRIPPQSLEMEQAVLGAMIIEREAVERVQEILRPEDFYRDAHRRIFEAITALALRDEPVDLLTVQEELREKDALEAVGGLPYLTQLTDAVPTAANAEHYARVVEEKAILRRLIAASTDIRGLAHDDYTSIAEVVDRAERIIFNVAQSRMGTDFTEMRPLIDEVYGQIEERVEHHVDTTGLPTSFAGLDRLTSGLQPSDFVIVAARPSMGKTALAIGMAQHIAVRAGKSVAIFSLEMSKEQLCLRMISSEARVDARRLRTGYIPNDEMVRVGGACARLAEAPIYIDDTSDVSSLEMRAKCRRLKSTGDLSLVVVDYLQLMRAHKATDNRTQEIGEIARSLKGLARELSVPVIALSQLSRAIEQRTDKMPMLSDLRESGSIEAEADLVLFIHRPAYYQQKSEEDAAQDQDAPQPAELILAKHRNGPTGKVSILFEPRFARFENMATDEPEY